MKMNDFWMGVLTTIMVLAALFFFVAMGNIASLALFGGQPAL